MSGSLMKMARMRHLRFGAYPYEAREVKNLSGRHAVAAPRLPSAIFQA